MSYLKKVKDVYGDSMGGFLNHDKEAINDVQWRCLSRLSTAIQLEQEVYLAQHPEIAVMTKILLAEQINLGSRKGHLKQAAEYFSKPYEELDHEIRRMLNAPAEGPYNASKQELNLEDKTYIGDIEAMAEQFKEERTKTTGPVGRVDSEPESKVTTKSSSFISIVTSDSSVAFSIPSTIPTQTLSETFYEMLAKVVDKATLQNVREPDILYDTAYVEIQKAVESAMESTVLYIKEDVLELLNKSLQHFDEIILLKAARVAQLNWERRMRKKLKKTLRRLDGFKGHKTPPTPNSLLSSHESYKVPPPRPCACCPQYKYNRYAKDRFGIYIPTSNNFSTENTTVTPAPSFIQLSVKDLRPNFDIPATQNEEVTSANVPNVVERINAKDMNVIPEKNIAVKSRSNKKGPQRIASSRQFQ